MTRFGIVGSDNSHALAFSELCNVRPEGARLRVPGAQVVAICGADPARTREVAEKGRIPKIVAGPEEMLGLVDAALVVHRHGGLHLAGARPFLEAGLPVFVDKPLAVDVRDAEALVEMAARNDAPLTSFTTLRWSPTFRKLVDDLGGCGRILAAYASGPADPDSEYAGLFFYGVHTVELMLAAFGYGVRRVRSHQVGKHVLVVVEYDDRQAALQFLAGGRSIWHVVGHGTDGARSADVDASDCYYYGLRVVVEMVETRRAPLTPEQLLEPIRVLAAIERSRATGEPESTR